MDTGFAAKWHNSA